MSTTSIETEEDPPQMDNEDRRRSLTCNLCLDIFRAPKLLPCSHTFCLRCLQALLAVHSPAADFGCPNCRRRVGVPKEGPSGFQTNFYLHPEDLAKARDGTQCLTHPEQDLDLYCVPCRTPVCLKCKLVKHDDHKVQGLCEASAAARAQLSEERQRVQDHVDAMIKRVELARKEQQTQLDKRTALESIIRKQHGTLVAAAEKFLVEALATLKTESEGNEIELDKEVDARQSDLDDLCRLQETWEKSVSGDNRYRLLAALKDMQAGRGSPQALGKLPLDEEEPQGSQRRSHLQTDFVMAHFLQFQTTVSAVEDELVAIKGFDIEKGVFNVKHIRVQVAVEKQFKCGKSHEAEVYSLCPTEDGSVWVSYVRHGMVREAPCEKYDSEGKLLCFNGKAKGRVSFKHIGDGRVRHLLPFAKCTRPYCKTGSKVHYKLSHSVNGRAEVTKVKVTQDSPFTADLSTEFSIQVGTARAFDVDSISEQLFVVLEETPPQDTRTQDTRTQDTRNPDTSTPASQDPDTPNPETPTPDSQDPNHPNPETPTPDSQDPEPQSPETRTPDSRTQLTRNGDTRTQETKAPQRRVLMFRRPEETPVAVYEPPTPSTFLPADVCFCRLGGNAAVLVADELGDSIHVLHVHEGGGMSFLRYLAPGSPVLVQPTAMNTDSKGRLWVACRGGQLITMFPVT